MSKEEKNSSIKASLLATKNRRKGQVCKSFEIKVGKSHLSKKTLGELHKVFLEAKWLYNYLLSLKDVNIFKTNTTEIKKVTVLNKDKQPEERELTILGSQMKQDVHKQLCSSIKGLSVTKKKGRKVGKLKFKSEYNSVNLKQYGTTYRILGKNKIRIQGIKQVLTVNGLKQIKPEYELANAKLIRRDGDFYIKITCFVEKPQKPAFINPDCIGLDFGIKTDITFSEGTKIDTKLPISKKIKKAHKDLSRKERGSKNRFKAKIELGKAYQEQNNIKDEIRNKVVGCLAENFGLIAVQDENIKGWHSGLFGKQVQQSAIGGIIRDIKELSHTTVVDRFFPSTQLCPHCGQKTKIGLDERIYHCPNCGYSKDRDTHSAGNIINEALNNTIPTERRNFKPVEKSAAAFLSLAQNCKWISVNQEATQL